MQSVIRDSLVEDIDTDSYSSFLVSNEYHNVTFAGKVGELIFVLAPRNDQFPEYVDCISAAEKTESWGVDISRATGSITLRGYDADGFTINRDYQAIVRNVPEALVDWRRLMPEYSVLQFAIHDMEHYGWANTLLCADHHARDFDEQLSVIERLRAEGIAE